MYEKAAVCRFGVCVLALVFACLLCFGGCAEEEYVAPEGPLLQVTSGEQTVVTYEHHVSSSSWSGDGFIAGDSARIKSFLVSLDEQLTNESTITYDDGVTFEPREDVSVGNLNIYIMDDGEVKELMNLHNSPHDVLDELEAGEYYVVVDVSVLGKYIKKADEFESSGYECAFKLIVE